jgi:hypothetical protein
MGEGMTIENVPLFDLVTPETVTGQQLIAAVKDGIDPRTGKQGDYGFHDEVRDSVLYGWGSWSETPIGTFELIDEWSGGDGQPMGRVVRHLETDTYILFEGTYSSWDGSEYDTAVVAEPYTFTETRYRSIDGNR